MSLESSLTRLREAAANTPSNLTQLEAACGGLPELPMDAWQRLILVALRRHLLRQRWVGRVVQEELGGDIERLAKLRGAGHPTHRAKSGPLPSDPKWEYRFHGGGCELEHVDGTLIDVNFFWPSGADAIDQHFYTKYLESVPEPGPIERAMLGDGASRMWWMPDVFALHEHELAHYTATGVQLSEVLEPLLLERAQSPSPWRRAWLACVVGDYLGAKEALTALGGSPRIDELARAQLAARIQYCMTSDKGTVALEALAQLGQASARSVIAGLLARDPVDASVARALAVLDAWHAECDEDTLLQLAERAIALEPPVSRACLPVARIILRAHGGRPALSLRPASKQRLVHILEHETGGSPVPAAFLLAGLSEPRGYTRLQRALQPDSSLYGQIQAACALAMLGTAEARALLRASEVSEAKALTYALEAADTGAILHYAPETSLVEQSHRPGEHQTMHERFQACLPGLSGLIYERFWREYGEFAVPEQPGPANPFE